MAVDVTLSIGMKHEAVSPHDELEKDAVSADVVDAPKCFRARKPYRVYRARGVAKVAKVKQEPLERQQLWVVPGRRHRLAGASLRPISH